MAYDSKKTYQVQSPIPGITCVFRTGQDMTSLSTPAGVTDYAETANTTTLGMYTGGNSPRLSRLTVAVTTGKKSTYCNPDSVPAGTGVVKNPRRQFRGIIPVAAGKKVISVYVSVLGVKRAWNMKKSQHDKISGDFSALGIEEAAASDVQELVWGCEAPYPAKATKFDSTGAGGGNQYTTFVSTAKENGLTNGWSLVSSSMSINKYMAGKE
jgi:hypothetical protein